MTPSAFQSLSRYYKDADGIWHRQFAVRHYPAGSPKGGEFMPSSGSSGAGGGGGGGVHSPAVGNKVSWSFGPGQTHTGTIVSVDGEKVHVRPDKGGRSINLSALPKSTQITYHGGWMGGGGSKAEPKLEPAKQAKPTDDPKPGSKTTAAAKPPEGAKVQTPPTGGHPLDTVFSQQPRLASDGGTIPTRSGKPVPVQEKTMYHITTADNAAAILKNGFDLGKVNPRWVNDMALSATSSSLQKAREYFMPRKNGKPTGEMGSRKGSPLVALEVKVRGRFFDGDRDQIAYHTGGPAEYTRRMKQAGFDADAQHNGVVYVYNTRAITSMRAVGPEADALRGKK